MRQRAIIHIAGPEGAGKTTLVERLLHGFDGRALVARCTIDDKLKESNETTPKNHLELRRYAGAVKKNPRLMAQSRVDILEGLAKCRKGPQPKPTEHWAIADGYAGIERAQIIVVNIRDNKDREGAERLLVELDRIRKDAKVFDDVLGWRGKKTPVTAVIADVSDAREAGTRKAVIRIRRKMRLHH